MSELVYGKNSVREILKSERKVLKLYLVKKIKKLKAWQKLKKLPLSIV